ncbi:hypothetical protein RND59_09040 [Vibrio ruber]|nr:hypothetical protein [Vibrio ruber]WNJ94313.1 hypothetical protein RND59_09040 [Vibrio ruber]
MQEQVSVESIKSIVPNAVNGQIESPRPIAPLPDITVISCLP